MGEEGGGSQPLHGAGPRAQLCSRDVACSRAALELDLEAVTVGLDAPLCRHVSFSGRTHCVHNLRTHMHRPLYSVGCGQGISLPVMDKIFSADEWSRLYG